MAAVVPPAIVVPDPDQNQPDVIEVIGVRSDQAQKIDRRTFRVQDNPHVAQKDAVQLLRGLPAVTVAPDGSLMLLGSGGVSIFVNGRPYQGDANQYLRTLHGSDIERVEIITNPSAQYSSEGTGGIINLVLRRKRDDGLSGSANGEVSSLGKVRADGVLKYRAGRWAYEAELLAQTGRSGLFSYDRTRSVEGPSGGPATVDVEHGRQSTREDYAEASAKVTYEANARTSLSAKLDGAYYRKAMTTTADFAAVTSDFRSFSEQDRKTHISSFLYGQLNLDHKGRKEGDSLTAEFDIFGRPGGMHDRDRASSSDGGLLSTDRDLGLFGYYGQADWQHGFGRRILSVGGSVTHRDRAERYRAAGSGAVGSAAGPYIADRYRSVITTASAYATFQQPIGSWTVMPGIRVEGNERDIFSGGAPVVRLDRVQAFPTLHIDHHLDKSLELSLSYSKRIDRADADKLRPYRIVEDVITAIQGNPTLRDQSTDAYEVNLRYHRKAMEAGMILYDRETSRLWSTDYRALGATSVYTWINAGHRRSRGAEFDLATPIVKQVKVNESLNLFEERGPVAGTVAATVDDRFRYTASTTIEWDRPDRGAIPGDVLQAQWTYGSPSRQFQLRDAASNWVSLSATHNFSRTVSLSGTGTYASGDRHRLFAPTVQESYDPHGTAEFKLKLLKTFGKH